MKNWGEGFLTTLKKELVMFTEITGNADLYEKAACRCTVICRQSCFDACMWEIPSFMVQADDMIAIIADEQAFQN